MAGRAGRLGEYHFVWFHSSQRSQQLDGVALAEHGEDRDQPFVTDQPAQSRAGLHHRGRIVPAVQDDARLVPDYLKTPRPACRAKAGANFVVGNIGQQVRRGDRQRRVGGLIVADQGKHHVVVFEAGPGHAQLVAAPSARRRFHLYFSIQNPNGRARGECVFLDDRECRALAAGDDMVARLDDRRLFMRDLLDGVSEIFLVVEVDVGDHHHAQVQRVGGVEPAAEPDLADQPVDPWSEVRERHRGQRFELGGWTHFSSDRVERRDQVFESLHELGFGDRTPVHLDAFGVGDEVRLGHETDPAGARREDRCQARARRTLSVGPRDERALECPVGLADPIEDCPRPLGSQLHAEAALL